MAEMERQRGELEDSTVRFIRSSTSEMVDELGFRALEEKNELAQAASKNADTVPASLLQGPSANSYVPLSLSSAVPASSVVIIPVRDGSDDLISTMLAQVLDQAGFRSTCIPIQRIDETVSTVAKQKPDLVFLSGMPPVAMARANRIFRSLRRANPALKIVMAIWHYNEDPAKAAQMISRTEDLHISTSLADAVAEAHALSAPQPAVEDPLDNSPNLVATPTDTAA